MSKFIKYAVLSFVFALVGGLVHAQEKIAVINLQGAILQSDFGKSEILKLEKSAAYSQLISEFEGLRADLQALDTEAQANTAKWGAERVAEYNKQRQFLQADLELNVKKRRADQQAVIQSIYAAMGQKAQSALGELIESESITLLLAQEAVIHASPIHDLTSKLAEKLSK